MTTKFPLVLRHKDILVKLYNWMAYPKGEPARNVEAFDLQGNKLWTIEPLGGGMPGSDFYTDIFSSNGQLCAFNYQAYNCIIDEATGKVISSHFTK